MAKVRVGINGLGRIGRTVLREVFNRSETDVEVVAANDLGVPEQFVHLLRYDSVHGRFGKEIKLNGDVMTIENQDIKIFKVRDPAEIPWSGCFCYRQVPRR